MECGAYGKRLPSSVIQSQSIGRLPVSGPYSREGDTGEGRDWGGRAARCNVVRLSWLVRHIRRVCDPPEEWIKNGSGIDSRSSESKCGKESRAVDVQLANVEVIALGE